MELPVLLLLVAVVWLVLLPSRIAGTVHRIAGAGALAAATLLVFLLLQFNRPNEIPADYAEGDVALRAMLE
jgi:hypothetical protein